MEKWSGNWLKRILKAKPDVEDIVDMYEMAAKQYMQKQQIKDALRCYEDASRVCASVKNYRDQSRFLISMYNIVINKETEYSQQELLGRIIELNKLTGNNKQLAKYLCEQADMSMDAATKIQLYSEAADLYRCESQPVMAQACVDKMCDLWQQGGQYREVIEAIDGLITECVRIGGLRAYRVPEYCFRVCLCYLAEDDMIGFDRAFSKYNDIYGSLETSREGVLLKTIREQYNGYNVEEFTKAMREYNNIKRLDDKMVSILCVIKKKLEGSQLNEENLC